MTACRPVSHIILGGEFDFDELQDIANHGANTGVHGFTYSSDLYDMFNKYEDQIMDELDEYCEDNFAQSAAAYIAGQHMTIVHGLCSNSESLRWMYLEMRAWFVARDY